MQSAPSLTYSIQFINPRDHPYQFTLFRSKMVNRKNQEEEEHGQKHESLSRSSLSRFQRSVQYTLPYCGHPNHSFPRTYHNTVIPRENRQLIQPSNKIPPRGDVARYEDTESENRKGVHEFSRSRCSVSAVV